MKRKDVQILIELLAMAEGGSSEPLHYESQDGKFALIVNRNGEFWLRTRERFWCRCCWRCFWRYPWRKATTHTRLTPKADTP